MHTPHVLLWRHVMVSTRCTWLHGDRRGFRNRKHRIHSSGDYKNPPPASEHEGLREYHRARSGTPRLIGPHLREVVARAFLSRLLKEKFLVLAVAVSERHVHALVLLPDDRALIREIIGRCKRAACEAVKHEMTGALWADGGEFKQVRDRAHQLNVYKYILVDQGPGAWTWSYRDEGGLPRFPEKLFGPDPRRPRVRRSGTSLRSGPGVGRR